ncbi:3-oxoacyl-[acyl-carrier protein] reductase [Actinoplanes octamycinicus]|uniref:3-oxoacyl-[acyl-carrier protein] reductase n=1 Tax=Actinoplanes octamycinicus TaxID=135948 RepID=A0A7W7GR18_9ACTN|nr:SDR family oxidoreductase [Actinoplanes octamycinicus]MBB4736746.1 3-oxoacyl-[acyl-carrier protein] reductase [Actinoplanes octamycinicus]GIE60513.1 3-oxoacyl-ACP reductase [Actinoplanes octamycinicus]
MTLTGKTALVTGGSRGIGQAIVRRLAADGARVVFTYRTSTEAAEKLAAEIGNGAVAVRCDQADPATLPAIFEPVRDGLDILVNNAGTADHTPIAEVTEADFDRVLTINTKFPLLAIQAAAPLLRDGGRIINLSTLNTVVAGPGMVLYCASKAALEQVTAVAAKEFGPRGITVNTVSPGATDTDMLRSVNTPEGLEASVGWTALGRLGQPSDVAAVVAFLAGPDSAWVTGQNIRATGGLVL